MENGKKMYVTAEEAAEMLGVSTGYAYKIIRISMFFVSFNPLVDKTRK